MGLILGGVSASDLIMDGQSVSLYVGGNPPTKVWPTREVVQITLGTGSQAQQQLQKALADRGLGFNTSNITEIPFDIELVGSGSAQYMFDGCAALTSAPALDTSQVTNMTGMFWGCAVLAHVPDMDTSQVTSVSYMFRDCAALTDGNVRLIGRHPNVTTAFMIRGSGLTRIPFYDTNGNPI